MILIAAIIITICICKRRKKKSSNNDTNVGNINTSIDSLKKPDKSNEQNIIIVEFETTSQYKIKISFHSDKTVKELIKFYFETIKKPHLYGNMNIRFLLNGNFVHQDSKDSIKELFKNKNITYKFIVDDLNDIIDKN